MANLHRTAVVGALGAAAGILWTAFYPHHSAQDDVPAPPKVVVYTSIPVAIPIPVTQTVRAPFFPPTVLDFPSLPQLPPPPPSPVSGDCLPLEWISLACFLFLLLVTLSPTTISKFFAPAPPSPPGAPPRRRVPSGFFWSIVIFLLTLFLKNHASSSSLSITSIAIEMLSSASILFGIQILGWLLLRLGVPRKYLVLLLGGQPSLQLAPPRYVSKMVGPDDVVSKDAGTDAKPAAEPEKAKDASKAVETTTAAPLPPPPVKIRVEGALYTTVELESLLRRLRADSKRRSAPLIAKHPDWDELEPTREKLRATKKELGEHKKELDDHKRMLANADAAARETERQLGEQRRLVAKLTQSAVKFNSDADRSSRQASTREQKLRAETNKAAKLRRELEDSRSAAQEKLTAEGANVAQLNQKFQQLKSQQQETLAKHSTVESDLRAQVTQLRGRNQELVEANLEAGRSSDQAQQHLESAVAAQREAESAREQQATKSEEAYQKLLDEHLALKMCRTTLSDSEEVASLKAQLKGAKDLHKKADGQLQVAKDWFLRTRTDQKLTQAKFESSQKALQNAGRQAQTAQDQSQGQLRDAESRLDIAKRQAEYYAEMSKRLEKDLAQTKERLEGVVEENARLHAENLELVLTTEDTLMPTEDAGAATHDATDAGAAIAQAPLDDAATTDDAEHSSIDDAEFVDVVIPNAPAQEANVEHAAVDQDEDPMDISDEAEDIVQQASPAAAVSPKQQSPRRQSLSPELVLSPAGSYHSEAETTGLPGLQGTASVPGSRVGVEAPATSAPVANQPADPSDPASGRAEGEAVKERIPFEEEGEEAVEKQEEEKQEDDEEEQKDTWKCPGWACVMKITDDQKVCTFCGWDRDAILG